jgi:RNA polymerase sigma-70 factor, ECF subfamily
VRVQPLDLRWSEHEGLRVAGPSDAELLHAIAHGSEPAFEELRRRYWPAVESACRLLAGREADDCAQEVFVRIWRKAELFDAARGSAAAWLLTLARNAALNVRAKRVPAPVPVDEDALVEEGPTVDRFWLEAALERLPSMERTVIELAYYEERSQSEIAHDLGVPLGTVKSWNRRGLNRLATLLGGEGHSP